MADTIASLMVKIGADIDGFTSGLNTVKNDMSTVEKGVSAWANTFKAVSVAGVAAVGAIATGIGMATKSAADMEQQVANIRSVFADAAPPVEDLNKLITDLGLDPQLKVTAVEAGQAIEMLAKNGVAWSDISDGMAKQTVILSNAVGSDLSTAADIATDAMAVFGLNADQMNTAVAGIVGVVNNSKFDINDYALALANGGSAAKAAGVSFEDFNALIALTSSEFKSGQTAGTGWASLLTRLVPSTQVAEDAMKSLGLITADGKNQFYDANGALKDMDQIITVLQGAFGNLSEEQRAAASHTIFGRDAAEALNSVFRVQASDLEMLKSKFSDLNAVSESANTRMDTLSGAWEIFTGILETLQIGIGQKFLPIARRMVEWITEMAGQYGPMAIEWAGAFSERIGVLADAVMRGVFIFEDGSGIFMAFLEVLGVGGDTAQRVGRIIYDFGETIKNAIGFVSGIVTQFYDWHDAAVAIGGLLVWVVGVAISPFLAALGAGIAIFAALATASAILRTAWENDWLGIRSTITYAWEIISGVFNSVAIKIAWIVDTFKTQWAILTTENATLGEKLALIWATILDIAYTVWQGIVTTVLILWPKFVEAVTAWGTAAWQWLGEAIPQALTKIAEWGAALWGWVVGNAPEWIDTLGKWATAAWEWLVKATTEAVKQLGEWGSALWKWLTDNAPKWMETLGKWGAAAWQWIVSVTGTAVGKLGEWGGALLGWLRDNLPGWIAAFYTWMAGLVDWLADAIPGAIRNLTEFVRSLREEGSGPGLSSFLQMVGQWATALWEWIVNDLIPAAGPAFMQYIEALLNLGHELWVALGELAVELGKLLWDWIVAVTPTAVAKLGEWGAALWGWVQDNMPEWMRKLGEWANAAWEWIVNAVPPALEALRGWAAALWDWIVQNAPTWLRKLGEWGKAAWQWIADAIPPTLQKLGEWGSELLGWVTDNVRTWVEKFKSAAGDIVDGFKQGIQDKWNGMLTWLGDRWNEIATRFKSFFGIASPSTLFAGFGSDMMAGLQNGLNSAASGPLSAVDSLASQVKAKVDSMVAGVQNSVGAINNSLNSIGSGGTLPTTPTTGANSGYVPQAIAEKNAAIAYGGYKLGVGVNQVQGLTDVAGFATEFMTFVDKIGGMVDLYNLAPSGTAQGQALQILQSGSVFDQKVDDVLSAIQTLLRLLAEKGLGNQFFVQTPPDENKVAKYELIELVQYLNALYGT